MKKQIIEEIVVEQGLDLEKLYLQLNYSKCDDYRSIIEYFINRLKNEESIKKALNYVLENNLLFEKDNYRIPLIELPNRVLGVLKDKFSLNSLDYKFVFFVLKCTFCFPGIVGTPNNLLSLKKDVQVDWNIVKKQINANSDGFNSSYFISQMKGGLSLDVMIGCPMKCAYCYRLDDMCVKNWPPKEQISTNEIINRLLMHPWFTPHISPIGVHMSTTEAFLDYVWPKTYSILCALDNLGLTNRISIITKETLDDKKIALLEGFKNIDIDICVCFSGMPQNIEPSSNIKRLEFLKKILNSKSPHINGIAYYRPIVEGYNTSETVIENVVREIKKTGTKVVVLGGLKFSKSHEDYFVSQCFPLPDCSFEEGKKYLSDNTIVRIINKFKETYGSEELPAIFRRSSCARTFVRGSHYPDYNSHWQNESRNCSLNCKLQESCKNMVQVPNDDDIKSLLERINKPEANYVILSECVMINEKLSIFEKTFIMQNLYYPVVSIVDIQNSIKKGNKSEERINVLLNWIENGLNNSTNIEEITDFMNNNEYYFYENIQDLINNNKYLDNKTKFQVCWSKHWSKHLKDCNIEYKGTQKILATIIEMLYEFCANNDDLRPQKIWASNIRGQEFVHFISDKVYSTLIKKEYDDSILLEFCKNYINKQNYKEYEHTICSAFSLIINSVNSKFFINNLDKRLRIGFVIPMYNEKNNLESNRNYQNAINAKTKQLQWLFENNEKISYHVLIIDDCDETGSGYKAKNIIKNSQIINTDVIMLKEIIQKEQYFYNPISHPTVSYEEAKNWKKGGAVLWGLYYMSKTNDYIIYSDFDLTYPLEQVGNCLELLEKGYDVVAGSRKLATSQGYYDSKGPNLKSIVYHKIVSESLDLHEISDIHAGFKGLSKSVIKQIVPKTIDRNLSFDSELLSLSKKLGYEIANLALVSLHVYEKKQTEHDYDKMIKDSLYIAQKHRLLKENYTNALYEDVKNSGGLDFYVKKEEAKDE